MYTSIQRLLDASAVSFTNHLQALTFSSFLPELVKLVKAISEEWVMPVCGDVSAQFNNKSFHFNVQALTFWPHFLLLICIRYATGMWLYVLITVCSPHSQCIVSSTVQPQCIFSSCSYVHNTVHGVIATLVCLYFSISGVTLIL